MSLTAVVSYDGTPNDQDALMLARVFSGIGADLTLAYVRHSTQSDHAREQLEEHEAEALLARGAHWLGNPEISRRVVLSPSTGEGLRWLAEQEEAQIVIFGSDYRTAPGHVAPGRSAQTLLDGGPAAVAIAPAGYHDHGDPIVRSIGLLSAAGDVAGRETVQELRHAFGVDGANERRLDLLVVGSRPEAPEGRVMLAAQAQNTIENSTAPVLVLARGARLAIPVLSAA